MTQLATFEVRLTAVDKPTDRRRWNGGPMASEEADAALEEAVAAFRAVVEARGFEVARVGHGVAAHEVEGMSA